MKHDIKVVKIQLYGASKEALLYASRTKANHLFIMTSSNYLFIFLNQKSVTPLTTPDDNITDHRRQSWFVS